MQFNRSNRREARHAPRRRHGGVAAYMTRVTYREPQGIFSRPGGHAALPRSQGTADNASIVRLTPGARVAWSGTHVCPTLP
jgi:hypothetical protein